MPMPIGPSPGSTSSAATTPGASDGQQIAATMVQAGGNGPSAATNQASIGALAPAGSNSSCGCAITGATTAGGGSNEQATSLLREIIKQLTQLLESLGKIHAML